MRRKRKIKGKILMAGPWRSGSTGIFNLVRVICGFYGRVYSCFEDQYNAEEAGMYDFQVLKTHKYKPALVDWADLIITTY